MFYVALTSSWTNWRFEMIPEFPTRNSCVQIIFNNSELVFSELWGVLKTALAFSFSDPTMNRFWELSLSSQNWRNLIIWSEDFLSLEVIFLIIRSSIGGIWANSNSSKADNEAENCISRNGHLRVSPAVSQFSYRTISKCPTLQQKETGSQPDAIIFFPIDDKTYMGFNFYRTCSF